MPEKWTGDLVGLMHNHKVTKKMLADEIGLSKQYVCMILNSSRKPPGIRERMEQAVQTIIQRQENKAS